MIINNKITKTYINFLKNNILAPLPLGKSLNPKTNRLINTKSILTPKTNKIKKSFKDRFELVQGEIKNKQQIEKIKTRAIKSLKRWAISKPVFRKKIYFGIRKVLVFWDAIYTTLPSTTLN